MSYDLQRQQDIDRKARAAARKCTKRFSEDREAKLADERRKVWIAAAEMAEERAQRLRGEVARMLEASNYGKLGAALEGGAVELEALATCLRAEAEE